MKPYRWRRLSGGFLVLLGSCVSWAGGEKERIWWNGGIGGPAPEPAPVLRNPEPEKIRLVQNCELMMKMVRKH